MKRRRWALPLAVCFPLAFLPIALLALGMGWQSGEGVKAASCSVSGTISTDTTWNSATCDPFIVTGSIVVPSGVTLTIEPGTTVKFDSLKGLLVQGTLIARGTADNLITFTSNQATPAKGDWGRISFTNHSADATFDGSGNYVSGNIIQYAIVEYAGADQGALHVDSSSPYIDHNLIRNNGANGVFAGYYMASPHITNNTITGNTPGPGSNSGGGIHVSGAATVRYNTITGNTANSGGGISASDGATVSYNTITGNTAESGGGIIASDSATVSYNIITGNTASSLPQRPSSSGGGIFASGTVTITYNTITGNTALSGGGISAYDSAPLYPSNLTIENNNLYGNTSGSETTLNDVSSSKTAGSDNVNAENNYWGTTDPSVIEDHIWDFFDDSSLGMVDYMPFRTLPISVVFPFQRAFLPLLPKNSSGW